MISDCDIGKDSWESLFCKKIKPVNPRGSQPWIFIGRTDAEVPILWPPDVKSQLIGKDPDAGKSWRQEEKGTTELGSSAGKEYACNAGDPGSHLRSGISPADGIGYLLQYSWASLVAQSIKKPPAMRFDPWVWSLGWENPQEEGMATHFGILAWRIPMDRGAWRAIVHGVAKSWTWLSDEAQHSSICLYMHVCTHTHTHTQWNTIKPLKGLKLCNLQQHVWT